MAIHRLPDLVIVRVDSYDNKNMTGEVCCPSIGKSHAISNVTQLIFRIRELIDSGADELAGRDKIFEAAYRHGNGKSRGVLSCPSGRTFAVRICFDRYGTWQGVLSCMNTGSMSFFRSALEMLLMIDGELESCRYGEEEEIC